MNIKAKVFKREYNNLKGVASITIDDCFIITNILIMNGKNGLFVSMPNKKNAKGEYKDICYPLNAETRKQITDIILAEYNKLDEPKQEEWKPTESYDEAGIEPTDLPF